METNRIFDTQCHIYEFDARVLSCEACGNGRYVVTLDRTAFFPEEGGQTADTGTLGGVNVIDVQEENRIIKHFTDAPLVCGETVHGILDSDKRFRKMQNHTGEHIVSGIVHSLYGYDNVGFHLGSEDVTVDFNGELTREQLDDIERRANSVVTGCRKVNISFPSADELARMNYRSKLELHDNVRIVTIEDCDICACCAPHVSDTGEIGIIKILDFIRYKGGIRLHMLCGFDALEDYGKRYGIILGISNMLSAKQYETGDAVARLTEENRSLRHELGELKHSLVALKSAAIPQTTGNICLFETDSDVIYLRNLANECVKKCGGICAVFSGDDDSGYNYIMISQAVDLRIFAKEFNKATNGRGGGSPGMIQGSCHALRSVIARILQ